MRRVKRRGRHDFLTMSCALMISPFSVMLRWVTVRFVTKVSLVRARNASIPRTPTNQEPVPELSISKVKDEIDLWKVNRHRHTQRYAPINNYSKVQYDYS